MRILSREWVERFAMLPVGEQWRILCSMTPADLLLLDADFEAWRSEAQVPPKSEGWRTWMMRAGRGFGKTRAGAEWIHRLAMGTRGLRIALVGATPDEVRRVMIEGESGLLRVARKVPVRWDPSLGRLTWPNGSQPFVYSGADPDGLRGPAHHFAWCDELAKWDRADETWDNLQMTMRAGARPRTLVTTTPRPIAILKRIEAEPGTVVTTGRTDENTHLPPEFVAAMVETYGGTRLGRQELDGEILGDVEGALWKRTLIEEARICAADRPHPNPSPEGEGLYQRVVVGVDPPASANGDACGIVAVGLGEDGVGYVLGDHSVKGQTPEGWAAAVAYAAELHGAERVVAESNQGGEMVESVLRSADCALPVRPVHARFGKSQRAEPVAILFEKGKAKFAGRFPELEDELAGMKIGGGYEGPGRSPDRADAMVWAFTELMLGKVATEPRVRSL